jgi:hypothetical protein
MIVGSVIAPKDAMVLAYSIYSIVLAVTLSIGVMLKSFKVIRLPAHVIHQELIDLAEAQGKRASGRYAGFH